MPQHQRLVDHPVTERAVVPEVHVRAAYPDRADLDEHLVRIELRDRTVLDHEVLALEQDSGSHLVRNGEGRHFVLAESCR